MSFVKGEKPNALGRLIRTYSVTWTDVKTGKVASSQLVNNRWTRVGQWDLPIRLLKVESKADGTRVVREIRLTDHKLLKAK